MASRFLTQIVLPSRFKSLTMVVPINLGLLFFL
jgi:hypothetical protein